MANPNQKYQATDIIDEPGLPFRRLVFAGVRDERWFVHYERGGIGHNFGAVFFDVEQKGRVKFVWGEITAGAAQDLDDLRRRVAEGKDGAAVYHSAAQCW